MPGECHRSDDKEKRDGQVVIAENEDVDKYRDTHRCGQQQSGYGCKSRDQYEESADNLVT